MQKINILITVFLFLLIAACSQNGAPTTQGAAQPITLGEPPQQLTVPVRQQSENGYLLVSTVNMSDVPAYVPTLGQNPPNKRHKRHPTPIGDEAADVLREAGKHLQPSHKLQSLQSTFRIAENTPVLATSFESLNFDDAPNSVPPDPELAVGTDHIIAVVNSVLEIYDKTGTTLVGPILTNTFFAGVSGCTGTFDPNVLYDEKEDRFFIGIDSTDGLNYCFAVSATSDPTGGWNRYSFPTGSASVFFDYPHAGIGEEAIFMGSNNFGPTFTSPVYAIDKHAAYAGNSVVIPPTQLTGGDTPQPMNLHGFKQGTWPVTGQPHYIVYDFFFDGTTMGVASWEDPFGANIFSVIGTVDLDTASGVIAGYPQDFPQSGSTDMVQGNDWRVQDAEYRDGFIWLAHSMACNPGTGSVNCLRWAKINPTVPSVVQVGIVASNDDFRQYPDLAVNHCNDVTLGYTKSNSSQFPAVNYTGRLGTDAANTMQTEGSLKAGEVAYSAFDDEPYRWGDYSGATSDPDGVTTWYLGEYSRDNTQVAKWGTMIGGFTHNSITQLSLETVANTQTKSDCRFEAGNSYVIGASGNLTLNAKLSAVLQPGFSVQNGGVLAVNANPLLDLTP